VASNVATLKTALAHGISAGDVVLVRGVHDSYDGYRTVVATPTTTTLTYALAISDESETEVSPSGAVSNRLFEGKRRIAETENLETQARALTAYSQGLLAWWPVERTTGSDVSQQGLFIVGGALYVRLPRDTTTDMGTVLDLLETLGAAINQECSYTYSRDKDFVFRYAFDEETQLQHDIVRVELTVEFPLVACV
jgi:hypothetical protein